MLTIQDLRVSYDSEMPVLDQVSLTIESGSIIGIIGPNGAGKSTFIKAILGLIAYEGKVRLDGKRIKDCLGQISYVEQKSQIDLHFPMTVRECVSLGLYKKVGLFRHLKKSHWAKVDAVLDEVGLLDYKNKSIKDLSGGQFQRVLLARCLVQDAQTIFLDEPFVGIDMVSEAIIISILKELRQEGRTILVVHHDLSKVETYFDSILLLNKKLIAYGTIAQVFTGKYLKKAYGDTLFLGKEE